MNYKITTLAENSVYGKGLQGEHGLSLLVEAGEHKVLFDTGASDLFLRNARLLGLDLSDVEYVVLSHGHSCPYRGALCLSEDEQCSEGGLQA